MPATLTKSEQLMAAADQFRHTRAKGDSLELSAEDQHTYDAMIAGARSIDANRGFRTQADADGNTMQLNGLGSGARLVDERGNVVRGLTSKESFAAAVCEQQAIRGGHREDKVQRYVEDGELSFGGYVRSLVTGHRNQGEMAALSGSSGTAGGYSVPPVLAANIIDKFRARQVMINAGAQTIPIGPDGSSYCKLTGDATAGWRQESTAVAESGQTFGAIVVHPKSLAVIVKISRELLQDSPNIDTALERSFAEAFAVELDRVGLVGIGAAAEPMGLYNDPNVNVISSIGSLDYYKDFLDGYKLILDDNAPDPTAVIHSNREWRTMAGWLDGNGTWLEKPPAIRDLPFLSTSAVPITQGSGADSCAFVGHFPDFIFGIRSEFSIDIAKELFAENHQVAFIAHLRADTAVFHPESFAVLKGITAP